MKSGFEHSVFNKDRTVVVQGMEGLGSDILPDVRFGRDTLDVAEDATLKFRARTTLMSGTLTRRYLGGFIKAAPMEGVICGGALVRAIGVALGEPLAAQFGRCLRRRGAGLPRAHPNRTPPLPRGGRRGVVERILRARRGLRDRASRFRPADGAHQQRREEARAAREGVRRRADGVPAGRHRRRGGRPRRGPWASGCSDSSATRSRASPRLPRRKPCPVSGTPRR